MGVLFVVAREERELYDGLVRAFAGRRGVKVVLDRRADEQSAGAADRDEPADPDAERWARDRRIRPHVAHELATVGWTVVRVSHRAAGV